MRTYDSKTDYHIVLEACRQEGGIATYPVYRALIAAGIHWPNLNPREARDLTPDAIAIDADIVRAWRELGYHN